MATTSGGMGGGGIGQGVSDLFGGGGQAIQGFFGSRGTPQARWNQLARPVGKPLAEFGGQFIKDVGPLSQQAVESYMGYQPRFQQLAGQQENVLNQILNRRLNYDPNQALRDVGQTAFSFIGPNVLDPLAAHDAQQRVLMRRARGLGQAADSTYDRLNRARDASTRYYDVARDAYGALPGLYSQAFNQGLGSDVAAAGYVPQIAQAYESVASRPWNAINQRIGTAGATADSANRAIQGILAATAGYKTPQNFADRFAAGSEGIGRSLGGAANIYAGLYSGGLV